MWWVPLAAAAPVEASLHGDVKAFFLAGVPREWIGLSDEAVELLELAGLDEEEALDWYGLSADPYAQGVASGRLKGSVGGGPLRGELHYALALQTAGSSGGYGLGTGVGATAPELLPLSGEPDTGDALVLRHRVDRLLLSLDVPHLRVALGRQPVSFGTGRIFTPLDLVNPFHPATIDTEYKPGVDALRIDATFGISTQLGVVAAWAGEPLLGDDADPAELADLVFAGTGQATVGVTDLLGFAGLVRAEPVFGLGTASSIGPVGVHAEAALTLPEGEDPFVRAVAGADGRPTTTTTLSGEVYLQSFGATDPEDYLAAAESERFARGEIWQMGQLYAALAVAQEITPLVWANASVVANLRDPSALVALGGSWSVADDADVVFGGYLGVGEAPERVELDIGLDPVSGSPTVLGPTDAELAASVRSEFGLYPAMGYLQLRAYF